MKKIITYLGILVVVFSASIFFLTANKNLAQDKPKLVTGQYLQNNSNGELPLNTKEQSPVFINTSDNVDAVASRYGWTQVTGTFTTIVGGPGTTLIGSNQDDQVFSALPIGFSFTFDGTAYTTFGVSANGWICMGSGVPVNSYNPISTGTTNNIISGFGANLLGAAAGNGISYQTSGVSPNRILTVEWTNYGFFSSGGLNEISFQIKLFESTNNIQITYGPGTHSTLSTMEVGVRGALATDFNNRTTATNWALTTPGTLNTASCTHSAAIFPAANLTYQWSYLYYNYNGVLNANSFPFGTTTGKEVQWLVLANEFNQPTAAPAGNITALYFFVSSSIASSTYTNMTIKLGQTAITTLPTGVIYAGALTTVYTAASVTMASTAGTWMSIPITPFAYDPTQSLVIDVTQCGVTSGPSIYQTVLSGFRRTYVTETACVPTYGGQDANVGNLGISVNTTPIPMTYGSSSTLQLQNGLNVVPSSTNNQIIQVQVITSGNLTPFNMTGMTFNTTGSTNPADLANAKVYYTGTSGVFATTTQFGSTISSPSGPFTVSGTQVLATGTNYFWLTYDAAAGATPGDFVDAQCTSITGDGTMGVRTPTITSPTGWKQIDYYCRGTVTNSGCTGTGIYINGVIFGTINNFPGACDPNANYPYAYNWYTSSVPNVEPGGSYPISIYTASTTNQQGFAVWVDWNNNNLFSDAGEYYSIGLIPSGGTNPIVGSISVPLSATMGNHRMRIRNNFSTVPLSTDQCTNLNYGETEDYTINVVPQTGMIYASSTTSQIAGNFYSPQTNLGIIGIQVVTSGTLSPISLTSLTLNTNGSTNPGIDITNAKVWYTGLSSVFATTTQFGSTFNSPSGSFTVPGSQVLQSGTNYFWITYDIPGTAVTGDFVDAECNSLIVGSSYVPTVQAPAGSRQILGSALCGTYTIPGSYASIAAAVADLNLKGVSCAVTFNVSAGYTETMPSGGYVITVPSANSVNTITFQKSGSGANPLISTTVAGLGTYSITSFGAGGDAFFKINGTDYVTINGIDMTDLYTGAVATQKIEYGVMLCKPTATDGCKNITISNCRMVFALTNVTCVSAGVYASNYTAANGIITTTSISGRHENIFIDGNTIENCITGMYFDGTSDATSPYNLYTNNVQVGVNSGNTMICGSRATTNAVTQYGIYTIYNDSMKIVNNTIRCNTGNNTPTTYGIFTSTGLNSSIDIIGNTISDSLMYTTAATSTQQAGIYNTFGQSPTTASNVINIQNNFVQNFAYPTAAAPTIYYIANIAGAQTVNITGNTVSNNYQGGGALGTATGTQYGMYNSATINLTAGSTYNVANNNINNIIRTQSAAGAGGIYGLYLSAGSITTNVNNNNVSNITLNTTTGQLAAIYCVPSITGGTLNIFSNTVNNISRTANVTTGITYLMYSSQSSATANFYGNTISNVTNSVNASTGTMYGYYNAGVSAAAENFYNNSIFNLTNAGTGLTLAAFVDNGTVPSKQVYGNTIYNITGGNSTTNTGGQAGGILVAYATNANIYKNRIYNITSYNASGSSPACYGLVVQSAGTTYNIYNNIISELKAPVATVAPPSLSIIGIFHNIGTANVYNNTVYLDAAGTGVNFGCAALWSNTAYTLDLRNNILINKSTPSGTGLVVAYQRNGTSLTTFAATSDRNNFYAGVSAANKLIFYDGTNSDQTLAAYKSRVGPTRDANSVAENSPFVNTSSSPYDLHLSSCSFSQCESNASVVSSPFSLVDDYDGNARYPNSGYPTCATYTPVAPDIGADEWGGQFLDAMPPVITYTPLGNGVVAATRAFGSVSATDLSGINISAGTKPRVYYKKATDANAYAGNTYCDNGWKWVEANGTTSPFDFTIDYTKLYDPSCSTGGVVASGDIIQYFVVAQDNAGIPNVAINSGTFAGTPASVADYANIIPVGGSINQYAISSSTYSGNYYIGTGQPYLSLSGSLQGFFQALNSGVIVGNITAYITSDLTEDGSNQLGALSYDIPGANYTVTIKPFDAVEKLISGAPATAMISFTGADNVTIDGNGGFDKVLSGTKYLRFRNTSGVSPVFSFINDSRRNTITNCTIESNNAAGLGVSATIFIGGTTGTLGNDSLSFIDCDIRDRSDLGGGTPVCAIFASGNVSVPNDYMLISGCNIYNTFSAITNFVDLYLVDGNANMTIQNNSFFQTVTRSPSNAAAYFTMIMATSGSNNLLTGNYLGGTAPLCGGSPMTFTDCAGMLGFRIFTTGISSPTTASNNTIANMDIGYTGVTAGFLFRAFDINGAVSAYVNCTNNTIGSQIANDNIIIRFNPATSAAGPGPCAIGFGFNNGSTGFPIGSVTNNTIGGITLTGTGTQTATTMSLTGIGIGATVNTAVNVTGNIVGGSSANSINNSMSVTTNALTMNGISSAVTTNSTGANISNNTVRNLNNTSTNGTISILRGIYHSGTAGFTASSNTINDLNCASTQAGSTSSPQVAGIMTTSAALNQIINQNIIYNLNANTTGAFSPYVAAICVTSSSATVTESRNRIYALINTATGSPIIFGIDNYWGAVASYCTNNQIALTNGEPTDFQSGQKNGKLDSKFDINNGNNTNRTNVLSDIKQNSNAVINNIPAQITPPVIVNHNKSDGIKTKLNPAVTYGELSTAPQTETRRKSGDQQPRDLALNNVTIYGVYDDATTAAWSYYYNSVYIGGQATAGALTSFCLRKTSYANNITDNIFFNARTNGGTATGKNYALTSTGIPSAATDYNVYVTFDPTTLTQYSGLDQTIAQWRTSTGRDKQTWSTTSSAIIVTNLFRNVTAGNLSILPANSEAWLVSGKGIAIAGQNIDYAGNTRVTTISGGCTDIGAYEFAATPPGNPTAVESAPPAAGTSTTYILWGRTIAQIDWGTGGSSYPNGISVNYYSGVNPGNIVGGNYSNSHTTVVPSSGTLAGSTYDITYYFGDNETYTITSPGTNTVLSKYNPTSWEVFQPGTGVYQTQLTYNTSTETFSTKVIGLIDFSDFALTDVSSPLPVMISSFSAATANRNIVLHWSTSREVNNRGFDIERRIQTDASANSYSEWAKAGFVEGHGTTNEQHDYSFNDQRLLTGKYQYRLKQIDYNNNGEYYSLHNPEVVEIGKPTSSDISQNYPNPSNPKSKIDFQIPFDGKVSIKVYDIIGKEVVTLINELKTAGFYTTEFDGTNLASGVYFYRILAEGSGQKYTNTRKMVLIK